MEMVASENMPRKLGAVAKEVRADASRLLVLKGGAAADLVAQLLEDQGGCRQWGWVAERYSGCLLYAGSEPLPIPSREGYAYPLLWISGWDYDSACIWDMRALRPARGAK